MSDINTEETGKQIEKQTTAIPIKIQRLKRMNRRHLLMIRQRQCH